MYSWWVLAIIILLSSLPIFAVYLWFRLAKYQFSLVRFLFVLIAGAVAFFPALMMQNFLNFPLTGGRAALFYHFFVRIAFTEELSRLLVLLIFFWINKYFSPDDSSLASWNHIQKGAATGLVAGLGFAVLETARHGYLGIGIILLRAITAAPLHAACGSRVGVAAVMFRSNPLQATLRLLTATAIHGIYNMMITMPGLPSIAAILVALSALATSILIIRGRQTDE